MLKLSQFKIISKNGCKLAALWFCLSPFLIASCQVQAQNNYLTLNQTAFATVKYEAQANTIKELLRQNKFAQVEQILAEALAKRLLTRGGSLYAAAVLDRVFAELDPQLLIFLDRWVQQNPQSSLAYTARSYFYYFYAWSFRGNKYTNKTSERALQEYTRQLTLCAKDIQQALSINQKNPLALFSALRLGRNGGMPLEIFNQYFERLTAIVPFFNQAYQEKSLYLAPNWYGDSMTMLNFAKTSSISAPRGTAIPLLLPQAHDNLCNYERNCNKSEYYQQPLVWQDIEDSYLRLIEDFPRSGVYAYWFAKKARRAGKTKIARKYYEMALRREPDNKLIRSKQKQFR